MTITLTDYGLTKRQISIMSENVERFRSILSAAIKQKLKTNKDVCGYQILAPIGKRSYTSLLFHGTEMARVMTDGTITIFPYINSVYGKHKIKYDILCELVDEFNS